MQTFQVGDKVTVSSESIRAMQSPGMVGAVGEVVEIKGPDGFHTAVVKYSPTYAAEFRLGDLRCVSN